MNVFKFGGASVKNADGVRNVAHILNKYPHHHLLVVVSAMDKTTNALEAVVNAYYHQTGNAPQLLNEVRQFHENIMRDLFPAQHEIFDLVNDIFVEIDWVIEDSPSEKYDYLYDQIVSVGELVSSRILSAFLQTQAIPNTWFDIRNVLLTDNTYRDANIQWTETQQRMKQQLIPLLQNQIVVTQGFIGCTSENFTTTLGREGSDYTAAICSYCLDAHAMTIWKDVPGVLTADPKLFKNATKIDHLSFAEAIEMTYYGAKVIHPKTIKPIQNKNIPLHVKSFLQPQADGTLISADTHTHYPPVVVVEPNQALLHISTRDFSFVAEDHLSSIFTLFAKHRIKVNLMQNTAISFSVCINYNPDRVQNLLNDLQKQFNTTINHPLELITIRHHDELLVQRLKTGKRLLLEQRLPNTLQMVVSDLPDLERIA